MNFIIILFWIFTTNQPIIDWYILNRAAYSVPDLKIMQPGAQHNISAPKSHQ